MARRRATPTGARVPADTQRAWQPREQEMAAAYLAERFPQAITLTRVRLGSIPTTELLPLLEDHEVRMMSVFRRWADAIAITSDTLYLMEMAIRPNPGKISQIQLYRRLLPHTSELQQYLPREIAMQLVYAVEDPVIVIMAREAGIQPVFFRTPAVEEYLKIIFPRERRAPRAPGEITHGG